MEPRRAQRGRKRKSTESTQKPKKEPQRGLGVEKLERLREISESTQSLTQSYLPLPAFLGYGPVAQLGVNQMDLGLMGPIVGPGFGGPGPRLGDASRELDSVPNMNQLLDHWGLTNLKHPLNSGGLDREKSPSLASYVCGNVDQEAEVKAVHSKGNLRVIEYGFFPQQKTNDCKSNTNPKDDDTPSLSLTRMTPDSPSTSINLSLKL